MKLDLEDIGMCLNKSLDNNIHMVEKTTQTESFPMASPLELEGTPNGTTPCNHHHVCVDGISSWCEASGCHTQRCSYGGVARAFDVAYNV